MVEINENSEDLSRGAEKDDWKGEGRRERELTKKRKETETKIIIDDEDIISLWDTSTKAVVTIRSVFRLS